MSLYTLYRPRDWYSVIGQDLISTILRNSLRQGRVGHAYIFTGSRGTGKTTSARILAKGVNCENLQDGNPCHECASCRAFDNNSMLDIIEIDAASNTGVDNIRDLIDKARYEPTMGKWKVYIIDEVHMLSGGAFNALLKTLEEPPPHVKFILATTEIEKVPETIRSRSLRFDFRKITESDIMNRLQFVADSEGINIEDEALRIIAKAARGALRDALTLLEQNTINSAVSTEYVRSTLALLEESLIAEIIDTIYATNISKILEILETLRERHVQVRGLFDQILYALHDRLFASLDTADFSLYESIFTVFESAYTKIKGIPDGMLLIEITLLRAVKRGEIGSAKIETGSKSGSVIARNEAIHASEKPNKPMKTDSPSENDKEKETGFLPAQEGQEKTESKKERILRASEGQEGEGKKSESRSQNQETLAPDLATSNSPLATTTPFSYATLLRTLKEMKPALVTDLKMARYEIRETPGHNDEDSDKSGVSASTLLLIFSKEWNYTRVNASSMKNIILEALELCFSGSWKVECALEQGRQGDISDGIF